MALLIGISISYLSRKIIASTAGETNKKLKAQSALCNTFTESIPLIQTHSILPYFQENTGNSIQSFIQTAKKEDKIVYFWTGIVQNYHTLFRITLSALMALPMAGGSFVNLVFFTMLSNIVMEEGQKGGTVASDDCEGVCQF